MDRRLRHATRVPTQLCSTVFLEVSTTSSTATFLEVYLEYRYDEQLIRNNNDIISEIKYEDDVAKNKRN